MMEVGQNIRQIATFRWLLPEEILVILSYPAHEIGLEISFAPPIEPQSGQIFLFEDSTVFKHDGIAWAKKKSQDRVQETYMNIKINGLELIRGIYCKGAENPNFRRRVYRLMKSDAKITYIAHYRECIEEEKSERPILSHQITHLLNQCFPRYLAGEALQQPQQSTANNNNPIPASTVSSLPQPALAKPSDDQYLLDTSFQSQPMMQDHNDFTEMIDWFEENNQCAENKIPQILDLAPDAIYQVANPTKMLLCTDIALHLDQYYILFKSIEQEFFFPAQRVNATALRCIIPSLPSQQYEVYLGDDTGMIFPNQQPSYLLVQSMHYNSTSQSDGPRKLGKRQFSESSQLSNISTMMQDEVDLGQYSHGDHNSPRRINSSTSVSSVVHHQQVDPILSAQYGSSFAAQPFVENVDREYKIRIVEKLGYMKSALLHDDHQSPHMASSNSLAKSIFVKPDPEVTDIDNHNSNEDMKWLDENELSNLSNKELEKIMDQYIESVMEQLVQLAVLDEEMKAEIDALDSNGYSLLHYCCMYNLGSLIPVLVSKGAAVNRATMNGDTPLHLAIKGQHVNILPSLLEHGADMYTINAEGLTAYDLAVIVNNAEMLDYFGKMSLDTTSVSHYGSPIRAKTTSPTVLSPESNYHPKSAVENNNESSSQMSSLLHEVFASLSLTDKCALSLTLNNSSVSTINTPRVFPPLSTMNNHSMDQNNIPTDRTDSDTYTNSSIYESNENDDDISEIQSVFSATDKESLDKAMSMMGDQELRQVEDEVKKIQHNVRGWILRKNYNNLREAARVLQIAWREKKRGGITTGSNMEHSVHTHKHRVDHMNMNLRTSSSSSSRKTSIVTFAPSTSSNDTSSLPSTSFHSFSIEQERAAAKLQAATRRMTARKSISSITKQTVASLVIQKHLVRWWSHSKPSHTDNNSTAASSTLSAAAKNMR